MIVDEIVKKFKYKQLSYQQYLILAQVPDTLTAFLAYQTFKDHPNLTANDIVNFKKNLKNKTLSNLRSGSSSVQKTIFKPSNEADAKSYCETNAGDKACVCYDALKLHDSEAKLKHDAFVADYKATEAENIRLELEYNEKHRQYEIEFSNAKLYLEESIDAKTDGYYAPPPVSSDPRSYWIQTNNSPAFDNREYHRYWTKDYKNAVINEFIAREPRKLVLPKLPVETVGSTIIQCCSNTIDANNGATVYDIVQYCNQEASITEKEKADEEAKKKADEEARKKADEEAKKKAAEEEKKKADDLVIQRKKLAIILLVVLFIIAIVAVAIYVYNR